MYTLVYIKSNLCQHFSNRAYAFYNMMQNILLKHNIDIFKK